MHPRELITGRVGALAGVAFVLLLFFSVAMVDVPRSVADAEMVSWWSDDGNVTNVLISTYLQIGAAFCFLLFATALRGATLRAEGGTASLAVLGYASGLAFVVLLLASDGPRGVIAFAVKVNDETLPGVDLLRYMPQLGYILLGTIGGAAAGLAIGVNSLVVLRTKVFGRWLGVLGMICAAGTLAAALVVGPFFIPVMLVWVLAVSVALWRAPAAEAIASPLAAAATRA